MKHIKLILLFVGIVLISGRSLANNDLAAKAEKFYAEKNYKEAINTYEALLKEGFTSYKLYYNLGNAYYKNKELGKAIYNYELANKLEPKNEDILTNLKIANEKTIDKIESKENFFMSAIKSGLINGLSTAGWAWLSILSLTLAFILLFLFFLSRNLIVKRIGFFAGTISLILFVVSMVLGFSALDDKEHTKFAIITAHETRTHEDPSTTAASKFSLHEGTRVKVIETNNEWTNIKLENGNEAWVKTEELGLL
ncbi:MAG: hypothetical protein V4506_05175 [Bacteroidota bacterium]